MKKSILILVCLAFSAAALFAESTASDAVKSDDPFEIEKFEEEKTKTYVYNFDNSHSSDKNATVKIEFNPTYDEGRISYETLLVTYDRGEAMNAVMACLQDFCKEHKYYNYKYLRDDKESFSKVGNQRKAIYQSYVKFSR